MYTHLLLISTVQISRAYCSFFYYNIFIVSEQVFLRFFMNLSRHARMCNSSHHLQKATEKVLFAYKLTQNKVHQSTLRHCIQYEKTVFQWRPYRGEGILATVVKINNNTSSLETFEDQKLLFKGQLGLRKPMVQTDNSQSHRFSLSKYSGHSVIYICRIFKAHQNKHAHALAEIIDAFETSECHGLRLFPLIIPQKPFGFIIRGRYPDIMQEQQMVVHVFLHSQE